MNRLPICNSSVPEDIGIGDEVVISALTCGDFYAVMPAGDCSVCIDVNDELAMCDEQAFAAWRPKTLKLSAS